MIWLDIIFIITIVICMVLGIILFVDDKLKKISFKTQCFITLGAYISYLIAMSCCFLQLFIISLI